MVLLDCGLRLVYGGDTAPQPEPMLRSRFRSALLLDTGEALIPKLDLVPDVTIAPNCLSSFLGCDRLSVFQFLAEEEERMTLTAFRGAFQHDALRLLRDGTKDGWTALKAAFGNEPIADSYVEAVRASLGSTDFAGLVAEGSLSACKFLVYASSFLKYVVNDVTIARFGQHLVSVASALRRAPDNANVSSELLLEAVLNLARCEPTPSARVSAFASITADLVLAWPRLGESIRGTVEALCDDLPLSQTAEMWRLNLRLRCQ
jgi:hypothetical protein